MIWKFNSETTQKFIQEGVSYTHLYAPLVEYIQFLIHKECYLIFVHTLHDENASVDCLSKLGISLVEELRVFSICPSPLVNICLEDSMRIQFSGA